MVAHIYNPSYLGDRDVPLRFKASLCKKTVRPYLKEKNQMWWLIYAIPAMLKA
jgi:hypothetical protein